MHNIDVRYWLRILNFMHFAICIPNIKSKLYKLYIPDFIPFVICI